MEPRPRAALASTARRARAGRRVRRFRRSRRGVVSVVGTLLSLLVFFALFGVFITQYVPIWMTQNESAFTNQGLASIETLKQYVDDQVLLGAPQTYAVPFTMNSQGIPLFAQPTQGILSFVTGGCSGGFTGYDSLSGIHPVGSASACSFQHLGYWTGAPRNGTSYSTYTSYVRQNLSLTTISNRLSLQLPNRYFPGTTLAFVNNAVVTTQVSSAPYFAVAPPLNITHLAGNWTVTSSLITLTGASATYTGQGTKAVYASLSSNASYTSAGRFLNANRTTGAVLRQVPFNVTLAVGTRDVCAWYNFLSNTTSSSGLTFYAPSTIMYGTVGAILIVNGASFTPTQSVCLNSAGSTYLVQLTLFNMNFARAYSGVESVAFNVGGL